MKVFLAIISLALTLEPALAARRVLQLVPDLPSRSGCMQNALRALSARRRFQPLADTSPENDSLQYFDKPITVKAISGESLRLYLHRDFTPPEKIEVDYGVGTLQASISRSAGWYQPIPSPGQVLLFTQISKNGTIFEAHDYIGKKYFYRIKIAKDWLGRKLPGTLLVLDNKIQPAEVAEQFDYPSGLLERRIQSFDFHGADRRALALELTRSQEAASGTLAANPTLSGLINANDYSLRLLAKQQPLTIADLEKINVLVAVDTTPRENSYQLGVIRGSKRTFAWKGKSVTIDNRATEMTGGRMLQYMPAAEVPAALEKLLIQINTVNRRTSLREIAGIMQRLIEIHPFVDGNGRTTKVLLDHLLLKAGLPPMPHDPKLTVNYLFLTPRDIEIGFRRAYQNRGLLTGS